MSDSVRPHMWQPTRLLSPWDSPGKKTRVGCHFLLQVSLLGAVNLLDINLYFLQALVKFMLPNVRTKRVALKMPSPHPSTLYIYQEKYVAVNVH